MPPTWQKIKYLKTSKHEDEKIFSRLKGCKKKKFLTKSTLRKIKCSKIFSILFFEATNVKLQFHKEGQFFSNLIFLRV